MNSPWQIPSGRGQRALDSRCRYRRRGGRLLCGQSWGYLCRCSIPIDGSSVTRRSSLPGSERTETLSKVIRVAGHGQAISTRFPGYVPYHIVADRSPIDGREYPASQEPNRWQRVSCESGTFPYSHVLRRSHSAVRSVVRVVDDQFRAARWGSFVSNAFRARYSVLNNDPECGGYCNTAVICT